MNKSVSLPLLIAFSFLFGDDNVQVRHGDQQVAQGEFIGTYMNHVHILMGNKIYYYACDDIISITYSGSGWNYGKGYDYDCSRNTVTADILFPPELDPMTGEMTQMLPDIFNPDIPKPAAKAESSYVSTQAYSISGRAFNEAGKKIGPVRIVLYDLDKRKVIELETPASGKFKFKNIPDGNYTMNVYGQGGYGATKNFSVSGSNISDVNPALNPDLDQVQVSVKNMENGAKCSWKKTPSAVEFVIYRDNNEVGRTSETFYLDAVDPGQTFAYNVTAVKSDQSLGTRSITEYGKTLMPIPLAILPRQKSAIKALSIAVGFTNSDLNTYLMQNYGQTLDGLSRSQGTNVINKFQAGSVLKPARAGDNQATYNTGSAPQFNVCHQAGLDAVASTSPLWYGGGIIYYVGVPAYLFSKPQPNHYAISNIAPRRTAVLHGVL